VKDKYNLYYAGEEDSSASRDASTSWSESSSPELKPPPSRLRRPHAHGLAPPSGLAAPPPSGLRPPPPSGLAPPPSDLATPPSGLASTSLSGLAPQLQLAPTPARDLLQSLWPLLEPFLEPSARDGFFIHTGCGPQPYATGSVFPTLTDIQMPVCNRGARESTEWLRIPLIEASFPPRSFGRTSRYGDIETDEVVRGFHRTRPEFLFSPHVIYDWKNGYRAVHMSGIMHDKFMRNGVNDGTHRGTWFYLHFAHPWPAGADEVIIELAVSQSSIHSSRKHHMKYCAAAEPPGDRNKFVEILALHVPTHWFLVSNAQSCLQYLTS